MPLVNGLRLPSTLLTPPLAGCVRTYGLVLACAMLLAGGMSTALAQPTNVGSILSPPPPTDAEFRRDIQLPYREALRNAQPDRKAKDIIDKSIHYQVAQLVDPAKAGDVQRNLTRLINDIKIKSTSDASRLYALGQILVRCDQLLNEQKVSDRVVAVLLLNQLNIVWGPPDFPFVPAADPLLRGLTFEDKYIPAKVLAGEGLARILKDSRPTDLQVLKRIEIAEKVAAEIRRLQSVRGQAQAADATGHQWCMWSLCGALANCDRVYNAAREPVFADTLMAVLMDNGEDWHARAKAAFALSRLPYEATSNLAVLNYETAKFTRDMATTYNASVAAGQVWPLWRRVAIYIYFTYECRNAADRGLNFGLMYQTKRSGLNTYAPAIQQARNLVLPIVNTLIASPKSTPPIPQQDIDALSEWLRNNVPADGRLTPESRVKSVQPQAPPMANATPAPASGG